jgi:hypothetical protein
MSKERPILFSGPMVRALLDGSKTQTRRVVKPQPIEDARFVGGYYVPGPKRTETSKIAVEAPYVHLACPYGQPGDRLWVREAFDFLPSGGPDQPQACEIVYWATGSTEPRSAPHDYNPMIYGHQKVRPSIHMPRWASRITLEITRVRVVRLQDISDADCVAEGCGALQAAIGCPMTSAPGETIPRTMFRALWESINGPASWAANPWVWAVDFRKLP